MYSLYKDYLIFQVQSNTQSLLFCTYTFMLCRMGLERSMNVLYLIGYIKKILKINEGQSLFVSAGGNVIAMTTTMA